MSGFSQSNDITHGFNLLIKYYTQNAFIFSCYYTYSTWFFIENEVMFSNQTIRVSGDRPGPAYRFRRNKNNSTCKTTLLTQKFCVNDVGLELQIAITSKLSESGAIFLQILNRHKYNTVG